jgi:hypothetical protein
MVRALLVIWVLVPVGLAAWHFGPGQRQLARDKAGDLLRQAEAAEASQEWSEASGLYSDAAARLPEGDQAERNRLQLLQARARIRSGEILEGQEQLQKLLALLSNEPAGSPALVTDAFHELATAGYYAAWIMRREGATAEEWKPEAETARQLFRFLAERAEKTGDGDAEIFQKNLENTIRLEQMDLNTLLAKPPPKKCNCNCCKNLSQRKRKQCQSKCQNKGPNKEEDKNLKKIIHSAGVGEREGSGS